MLSEPKKRPALPWTQNRDKLPTSDTSGKSGAILIPSSYHHVTKSPICTCLPCSTPTFSRIMAYQNKRATEWKHETTTAHGKLHHLALGVSVWWSSCPCCHFQGSSCVTVHPKQSRENIETPSYENEKTHILVRRPRFLKLFKSFHILAPFTPLEVGNFSTNFTQSFTSIIKFIDDAWEGTTWKIHAQIGWVAMVSLWNSDKKSLIDVQLPVIPYEWSDMPVPKNPPFDHESARIRFIHIPYHNETPKIEWVMSP